MLASLIGARRLRLASMIVAGLLAASAPTLAQVAPNAETMVQKLLPDLGPSRSLRRGIVAEAGAKQAAQPQLDLMVNFEYRSAEITASGKASLDALGTAMKDKRLSAAKFRIVGHTDARGSPEYNMELSQRRADAVRDYLAQAHAVQADRMTTEGRGQTQLVDTTRPFDPVNRRVQVYSVWPNAATN